MFPQGWIAKIPTFARNFAYCDSVDRLRRTVRCLWENMGKYGKVWESSAAKTQHSTSWRHQPPTHNTAPVGGNILIPSHTLSYLPIKKPPSTALPGLPRPPAAPAAHTQHSTSQRQEFTVSYRFYRHQPHCRACHEGRRQWMQCLKCARRSARLNGDPQLEKLKKNPQKINLHP